MHCSCVIMKVSAEGKTLADKVFPKKETVSKPVDPKNAVEHYMHKFKHGVPLADGRQIESREQAIAIGMSRQSRKKSGEKSGEKKTSLKKTKKSLSEMFVVVPG